LKGIRGGSIQCKGINRIGLLGIASWKAKANQHHAGEPKPTRDCIGDKSTKYCLEWQHNQRGLFV
jgi:hypothetical protein